MSSDSVTVTTSKSFFSRFASSVGGILFGIILFLGSFVLLTWNEGRAIKTEKMLTAGASQVISISTDEVLRANEGKLVHFDGTAAADGPVDDPVFGISVEALKLRRNVEMYQWVENEKSETKQKLGGGEETVTTYTYSKKWVSDPVDSSEFQQPENHSNPPEMPVESETFTAEKIHVGAFYLPPSLVGSIDNFTPRVATADEADAAAEFHQMPIQHTSGTLYLGEDPSKPAVGDVRVSFEQAKSGPVSVIAAQVGDTLEPFTIQNFGSIELLKVGTLSAPAMFQQEQEGNKVFTWVLRLVGFVMMLFGLILIANVISVIASVIPFLGSLVGAGVSLIAFALALPLTLVTIALAWVAYRPLIGIPLLLVAGVSIFFAGSKLLKRKKPPQL